MDKCSNQDVHNRSQCSSTPEFWYDRKSISGVAASRAEQGVCVDQSVYGLIGKTHHIGEERERNEPSR
jgi:hypothetical protein